MSSNITTMVKKVNVVARIPIRTVNPPMHGVYNGISMTPANILKCLNHRAVVSEILSDGTVIPLSVKNYNTDNSYLMASLQKQKIAPKSDKLESAIDKEDEIPANNKIIHGTEQPDPLFTPDPSTVDEEHPMGTKTVEFKVGENGEMVIPPEVDEMNKLIEARKDAENKFNEILDAETSETSTDSVKEPEPATETVDESKQEEDVTTAPKEIKENSDAESTEKPKVETKKKAAPAVNKKKSGSTRKKK